MTMGSLLETLATFFTFMFGQLGNVATFFTTNLVGQIILGVAVFTLILNVFMSFLNKM